jgi:hypothetical protein
MTAAEILTLAGLHVDGFIDFIDGREWLNDALAALGRRAAVYDSAVIDATAMEFYALPEGALDITGVEDASGRFYTFYEVVGDKIRFADSGSYNIVFRRLPAKIAAPEDVPEAHEIYHSALALFVAARLIAREGNSQEAARLMAEFESRVTDAFKVLKHRSGRGKVSVIR